MHIIVVGDLEGMGFASIRDLHIPGHVVEIVTCVDDLERAFAKPRPMLVVARDVAHGWEAHLLSRARLEVERSPELGILVLANRGPQVGFEGALERSRLVEILLTLRDCVWAVIDRPSERPEALSPREQAVLRLVAEGCSSKDIAARLSIALPTVESHRRKITRKLGLFTIAELTRWAIRAGLVSLE